MLLKLLKKIRKNPIINDVKQTVFEELMEYGSNTKAFPKNLSMLCEFDRNCEMVQSKVVDRNYKDMLYQRNLYLMKELTQFTRA